MGFANMHMNVHHVRLSDTKMSPWWGMGGELGFKRNGLWVVFVNQLVGKAWLLFLFFFLDKLFSCPVYINTMEQSLFYFTIFFLFYLFFGLWVYSVILGPFINSVSSVFNYSQLEQEDLE